MRLSNRAMIPGGRTLGLLAALSQSFSGILTHACSASGNFLILCEQKPIYSLLKKGRCKTAPTKSYISEKKRLEAISVTRQEKNCKRLEATEADLLAAGDVVDRKNKSGGKLSS